jgi:hypothetical protein
MNRRLCLLPFHRKVKLTINDVLRMYQGLLRCDRNGGAVFVTSEHRLSLQLKGHELRLSEKGSGANSDSFERIHAKLDPVVLSRGIRSKRRHALFWRLARRRRRLSTRCGCPPLRR